MFLMNNEQQKQQKQVESESDDPTQMIKLWIMSSYLYFKSMPKNIR